MKKLLSVICITVSFNCFSFTDMTKIALNKLISHSEEIVIVDIIQVHPKTKNCGYLIDANVVNSFKGKKNKKISFWVKEQLDIVDGIDRYLVFANAMKNLNKKCLNSMEVVGGATNQTMFPFWTGKYILANRQSFLTTGYGFYDSDEVVKTFKVHNHRIHAVADWEKIKIKIKQQLPHPK